MPIDTVIDAIQRGSMAAGNISYSMLRSFAGRDRGCWEQLDRGLAILTSIEQLDQYLYTYGPMTKAQWDQALPSVQIPAGKLQIVDYGCGQGLASAMFFDYFGPKLVEQTAKVVLVERSGVALERAKSLIRCYVPTTEVVAHNIWLDDLRDRDLQPATETNGFMHLFSNVLDIDTFDHFSLFSKLLKHKGRHAIYCVSHDRDFKGGSERFYQLAQAINQPSCKKWLTVRESAINKYRCRERFDAIYLRLIVDVHHGSV